jgi:hypothetical protein
MASEGEGEVDEAQEDFDREHRLAQRALRLDRTEIPEGKVRRYESTSDCSAPDLADVLWIDRMTGKEVFRYDGADPANTNSYYGAMSDEEMFRRAERDPYELIDAAVAKPMPKFAVYDDGSYDDGPDDYCEHCQNTGEIDCNCGGDLCVCTNNGTRPCVHCQWNW